MSILALLTAAGVNPRPLLTVISILIFPPATKLQITSSGFITSISASFSISPAVTGPSSDFVILITFSPVEWFLTTNFLIFNTIVVTSSTTPSIFWNSCKTPSILIEVTALPGKLDRSTLLIAFPIVVPKPLSNGSISNLA